MESARVYSPIILVELICLTICKACIIFHLDLVNAYIEMSSHLQMKLNSLYKLQQFHHFGCDVSFLLLALAVTSVASLLYCYFGKITTESYEKMAERLFESKWYRLNLHLQKNFILIIANMQRPVRYHGCGVIALNLETFGNVSSSIEHWMLESKMNIALIQFIFRCSERLSPIIWHSSLLHPNENWLCPLNPKYLLTF